VNPATGLVDPASRRELLRAEHPQFNHNGGAIAFGPDGMLYMGIGDGGQASDVGFGHAAGGNAQNLNTVMGRILRIDPHGNNSANGQYGIPASNPFAPGGGLGEIYAYGFRNPYKRSFYTAPNGCGN
jgi:glucose/arabinose dehydrogenase